MVPTARPTVQILLLPTLDIRLAVLTTKLIHQNQSKRAEGTVTKIEYDLPRSAFFMAHGGRSCMPKKKKNRERRTKGENE